MISAKIMRNVANVFVSTGSGFDWWRPAWIMPKGNLKKLGRNRGYPQKIGEVLRHVETKQAGM